MSSIVGAEEGQTVFTGQTASSGIAHGGVFLSFAGLSELDSERLSDSEVVDELGRLDSVGRAARVSLVRQREALATHFTEEQLLVFDTHLQLLEDPVMEADVRERIQEQRMPLEMAVKDVFHVYERLFEVVETESLRNKMSDLRDVAMRYLRHCDRSASHLPKHRKDSQGGVLVVRELTLSDLTEALEAGHVAIVAETGSMTSHGAIMTQAAGLPAVIGIAGMRELVTETDTLLVDGTSGQVVVNPTQEALRIAENRAVKEDIQPLEQPVLADGSQIEITAAVASAAEARMVARMGVKELGLFRTELPLLQRQGRPKEASLVAFYRSVRKPMKSVTFRLPDLDSSADLPSVFPEKEENPALGLRGIRLLFAKPDMLHRQIRAMYKSAEGGELKISVPFVTGKSDLARVREAVDTVREELRLDGSDVSARPFIGAVVETPSAALMARELFADADFLLVGLDDLSQHLLASDRGHQNSEVQRPHKGFHPVVLRAVGKLCRIAGALNREITIFGESMSGEGQLELLAGVGARRFAVRPSDLQDVQARLDGLDLDAWELTAERHCRHSN